MHEPISWAPSASLPHLRKRATIMAQIRHFFSQRGLLEVETPSLSQANVTDVHLHAFSTAFNRPGAQQTIPFYLTTSPEFHMKRLLAAGSGPIFQLSKSFRNEESGRLHNPEFSLLEWYQPGYNMQQLMDEIEALLQPILACNTAERVSYQQVFLRYLALDPLTADKPQLQQRALEFNPSQSLLQTADSDTLLQFLFNVAIEPCIGQQQPLFIYHFPASQAALAQISPHDNRVAERFELYYAGIELANGFHELTDAKEQQHRFEQDNLKRQSAGLPTQPIDWRLLAALQAGLPDCSGVALGVDRLIMLALNAPSIQQIIAFESTIA